MTAGAPQSFRPEPESFERIYRGEPAFDGAPPPVAIPWDIEQAQPRLMELEALGAIRGEVLDVGCGLGDNAIFLASRGHSVTGVDGSATAIELATRRAAAAGAGVTFSVADATELTGFENRFDTVVDSALLHCLDDAGRRAYAAALHRATRPGARWFLYCFAPGTVNGVMAPLADLSESTLRDTLTGAGWQIDFLGPTTYLGNVAGFDGAIQMPEDVAAAIPAETLEQMQQMQDRMATILPLIDNGRVHLPFTVVHATRRD